MGTPIFLDARRFYPHIPQESFPAQRLAAEIYLDSGTRTMERGSSRRAAIRRPVNTGTRRSSSSGSRSPGGSTRPGTWRRSRSVGAVHERRERARGLEMVLEPTYLRFFQARFRPLEES